MGNYINYFITIIGLGIVIVSLFLIFSDRLKGEGLYFDLYVKEQEIKKAIIDADEMVDELRYTSEAIVNEIEQNINDFRKYYKEIKAKEAEQVNINETISENTNLSGKGKKSIVNEEISKNNKANEIYKYYNEGMEIGEIAKKLNMGKGEVSLILSIRNGVVKDGNV